MSITRKPPKVPAVLVELGRAVEVDGEPRQWTWSKRDNWIIAACPKGTKLFLFARPKGTKSTLNPRPLCKTGMQIVSYLFDREKWSVENVRKWLRSHDAKSNRIELTKNRIVAVQQPWQHMQPGSLRVKILQKQTGISTRVGCPKQKWSLNPAQFDSGKKLYSKFTRKSVDGALSGIVPELRYHAGKAHHVVYASDKFGPCEDYIHVFDARPDIWVDNHKNPKIVALTGAHIRVTPRGIEG